VVGRAHRHVIEGGKPLAQTLEIICFANAREDFLPNDAGKPRSAVQYKSFPFFNEAPLHGVQLRSFSSQR
jgi:hypothetical protein